LLIVNGVPGGPAGDHKNICILGLFPSGGVEKLALFVPLPSCASAFTESFPIPNPV